MSGSVIQDGELPALLALRPVLDALHDAGVRYCRWNGSESLADPASDVDVLCDRAARTGVSRILQECNLKRVVATGWDSSDCADYMEFDGMTGALTRLRVRYRLSFAASNRRAHHFAWEELYLDTRTLDERHRIYVAEPHLELITLLVRRSLALGWRDIAVATAGQRALHNGTAGVLRTLVASVEPERVVALATRLLGAGAGSVFLPLLAAGQPSTAHLLALRRAASRVSASRRQPDVSTPRLWRTVHLAWDELRSSFDGAPSMPLPTLPRRGIMIAVLGADGAGKSTVVGELAAWLSRHVVVTRTYGGSGKGSAGLPRRLMQGLAAWRRRLQRRTPAAVSRPAPVRVQPPTAARAVWVLALARERRRRALEAGRARARGAVVLSDRLAQSQFPGMNDGPRLSAWLHARSPWRRWAARRERAAFRLCEQIQPDLVIKLHLPPDIALRRKPETPPEQVAQGMELLRNLRWSAATKVVDLDATQPLEHVLLAAKRAVWEIL